MSAELADLSQDFPSRTLIGSNGISILHYLDANKDSEVAQEIKVLIKAGRIPEAIKYQQKQRKREAAAAAGNLDRKT